MARRHDLVCRDSAALPALRRADSSGRGLVRRNARSRSSFARRRRPRSATCSSPSARRRSCIRPPDSLRAAKQHGAFTVEINPETTPATSTVDLSLRGGAETVFPTRSTSNSLACNQVIRDQWIRDQGMTKTVSIAGAACRRRDGRRLPAGAPRAGRLRATFRSPPRSSSTARSRRSSRRNVSSATPTATCRCR